MPQEGDLSPAPARCSCRQPCAGEGSTAPSSSRHLHRPLQARLVAKQSPRNRHTRALALCCRQEPADSRVGELRRNTELPSLVSQVLTRTTPAAAVPEPLVTSKNLVLCCQTPLTPWMEAAAETAVLEPERAVSQESLPICSFSGDIRNPPGHKPVQPALAGGWTRCSPEAPSKPSHSV